MKATTFTALSEPNRLAMVELLRERPYSVNEIAERLQLRQPQVSKHLQTLSNAGLVAVYPIGQQRFYGLKPEPLAELDEWMKTFRPFWDSKSSIMERYLKLIEQGRVQKLAKEHPFSIERTFDAPLDLVWQAWTEANMLREWWAPDYITVPTCELDVRAGGQLRIDLPP